MRVRSCLHVFEFFPQNIVTPPLENENSHFGSRRHNDILVECVCICVTSFFFSKIFVLVNRVFIFFYDWQ
jgi:hypothetical protein